MLKFSRGYLTQGNRAEKRGGLPPPQGVTHGSLEKRH
jgi:hypothetical protein